MSAARAAVALTAVGCLLLLGWWARASLLEKDAQRISDNVFAVTDRARVAQAERDLERAERLNPDTRPQLVRGQLLLRAGRPRAAARVLRDLTRREPESVEAWALLAAAAARADPALAQAARERVLRLNPLLGKG